MWVEGAWISDAKNRGEGWDCWGFWGWRCAIRQSGPSPRKGEDRRGLTPCILLSASTPTPTLPLSGGGSSDGHLGGDELCRLLPPP